MIFNIIASMLLLGGVAGAVITETTNLKDITGFGVGNYIALVAVGSMLWIIKLMSNYIMKQADRREEVISQMVKDHAATVQAMVNKCLK